MLFLIFNLYFLIFFQIKYFLINKKLMNELNDEMKIILMKSNITKNPHSISFPQISGKNSFIIYRKEMIQNLKSLYSKYLNKNFNKLEILYLSILYLDIILSKNKILLIIENKRKLLCLCCFILSLKFIGDSNYSEKIIKNYINKDFPPYSIFETKCLYLLDYNLVYTTSYDYLNIILLNSDPKILYTCNTLLYSYIENNNFINNSPFYNAIAILKYSKSIYGNYENNIYNDYYNDLNVKNIELILQNEFKDIHKQKSNHNTNNNSFEEDIIWDMKTMTSTVERMEQRRISMSNIKKKSTNKFFNNEINNNQNNINTLNSMNLKTEVNFYNNDNHFYKKRNFSLNKNIYKDISLQYNIINKKINHYSINPLNIDLGQISKLPFEKLVKLSRRYMKTDK